METIDPAKKKQGIKIRLGKLDKKYKRAKRQGETELQMSVQSNIEDLKKELAEIEAFEKAQPPGPGPSPAAGPSAGAGLSPEEARLAVNMIVGVENTVLSAVAGRTFKMEISEVEQKSMEEALSLSAAKRLTAGKKEKLDLAFLIMAFLAPMLTALPKALSVKKQKETPAKVSTDLDAVAIEMPKVTFETAKPAPADIAGPMPPKVH